MVKLEQVEFNVEMVKKKSFEYFRTNIKDLVSRGRIGERVGGKTVAPTESDIKAMYEKITGFKVEKPEKPEK
jgi:hypothetical protein